MSADPNSADRMPHQPMFRTRDGQWYVWHRYGQLRFTKDGKVPELSPIGPPWSYHPKPFHWWSPFDLAARVRQWRWERRYW